jgi:hypothetical protein
MNKLIKLTNSLTHCANWKGKETDSVGVPGTNCR